MADRWKTPMQFSSFGPYLLRCLVLSCAISVSLFGSEFVFKWPLLMRCIVDIGSPFVHGGPHYCAKCLG